MKGESIEGKQSDKGKEVRKMDGHTDRMKKGK